MPGVWWFKGRFDRHAAASINGDYNIPFVDTEYGGCGNIGRKDGSERGKGGGGRGGAGGVYRKSDDKRAGAGNKSRLLAGKENPYFQSPTIN